MEHVIVKYPDTRKVFIDGNECGSTNVVLLVESGTHRFRLDAPRDYKPRQRTRSISETSAANPLEVTFERR